MEAVERGREERREGGMEEEMEAKRKKDRMNRQQISNEYIFSYFR